MKLLILGGTVFLGRHLVEAALRRQHQVTLFNRGQHNPDLFPQIEKLTGDRDGGLEVLRDRQWDAVIDTCGYVPRLVNASARRLADAVERYIFISTLSVYADPPFTGMDETAPLGRLEDETVEQITGETYGPLKALCEKAVEDVLPGRTLIIRPGLIVGPYDPSDRFTYWPTRLAHGGEVLAPDSPDRLTQFIDVRDLTNWILSMTENRQTGVFNATGPEYPLTFGKFLATCRETTHSQATFTWVSDQFLLDQHVAPYTELPLWLPGEYAAADAVSIARALSQGLEFRPLAETVAATWAWDQTRPPATPRRNGLSPEREQALLQAWHAMS
jgi:nucleoside-diphosphate-sugar epimerase